MRHRVLLTCTLITLLFCCVVPVSAVVQEITYKGQVSTIIPAKNTLSIKYPQQYGCDYPPQGDPACNWTPLSESSLTATVPDPVAYTVFSGAEPVIATNTGGDGGKWITIAQVYGSRDTEQVITDIVGDPSTIVLPLIANYGVDTETVPDCSSCSGTVCEAPQAKVTVKSDGRTLQVKTLTVGESFTYNGRNDGSAIVVKYISGEAASQSCPGLSSMTGPQARSVFVIQVTPPIGYGQVNIRTATTTRPEEALKTMATPSGAAGADTASATEPITSTTQTPSSGLSGYVVSGALVCCAVFIILRRG